MVEPQESEEISREEIAALLARGSEEMTREEAKGNLIHAIRWNDMPRKEALDIAIEAIDKCDKIEKIIDSNDADFISNYVRGLFAE